MENLPPYLLIGNKQLAELFKQHNGTSLTDIKINCKRFSLIGALGQALSANSYEFIIQSPENFPVKIAFSYLQSSIPSVPNTLIQITSLKLVSISDMITLKDSKKSEIKIPINQNVKTPSLQKDSVNYIKLWPVLIMPLDNYAIQTNEGLKFELRTLLNISEKVEFQGIVTKIENLSSANSKMKKLDLRDRKTNDWIEVYVSFSEGQADYINSVEVFDVLSVSAFRLISRNLKIYCKLTLLDDFSNLQIEKKHRNCIDLACPCKVTTRNGLTSQFSDFSLISEIKPSTLFRSILKLHIRVIFVNCIIFKTICDNCGEGRYKIKDNCCGTPKHSTHIIGSFIAEDSSGIAECETKSLMNLKSLLNLNEECTASLIKLGEQQLESVLRFQDFPEILKNRLKNLQPIIKYCVGKIEIKSPKEKLVSLNSDFYTNNISFKILKVFD